MFQISYCLVYFSGCQANSANGAHPRVSKVAVGENMVFFCDKFRVYDSGDMTQECQADGQLSGTLPTCVPATGNNTGQKVV